MPETQNTKFEEVNNIFFRKVEEDGGFFNYFNLSEAEAMDLATDRATSFLREAAARLNLEVSNGINFLDWDLPNGQWNFELTYTEKYLLASLQFEVYLSRNVARLKAFEMNFVPSDLAVFSPANDRTSFMNMYEAVKQENLSLLDSYKSKDRLSNEKLGIDYSSYSEV